MENNKVDKLNSLGIKKVLGTLKKGAGRFCNKRGELLIEGVASFVILIIILGAAMGLVFGSVNMNKKADKVSYDTENNIKIVNNDEGTDAKDGTMTITLNGTTVNEDIVTKEAGNFVYFVSKESQ